MVDLHGQLHQFKQNPFYSYFAGLLQESADTAVASICSSFMNRDIISVIEREQTIGATTAYLKFGQMVKELATEIQAEIKKQENNES